MRTLDCCNVTKRQHLHSVTHAHCSTFNTPRNRHGSAADALVYVTNGKAKRLVNGANGRLKRVYL